MAVPERPKIYHITHVDRLPEIIGAGGLRCDAEIGQRTPSGPIVGINSIKQRRLQLTLTSHPGLKVGQCVPFYFCPRSVMLYVIHRGNHPDLSYRGGQELIVHLEADIQNAVHWAKEQTMRWAFTLSNAGAFYHEDRSDLSYLAELSWEAITATRWSGEGVPSGYKEGKQAEFLMEKCFPWPLVECIGVHNQAVALRVSSILAQMGHRPRIECRPEWYY